MGDSTLHDRDSMAMKRTPPLSLKGSREVYEEMARQPEDSPERRATLERVRAMAKVRARSLTEKKTVPKQ
jgi:hypothetical protein